MAFKIDFNMENYLDIIPDIDEYLKHDYIINGMEWEKGNIDNCVWLKHVATSEEIGSQEFRERESTRVLKTGAWICIGAEEIVWLPPNYYFALQYGKAGPDDLQFRLKRLKHVYFKIRARNNPRCMGTFTIKNRADGETTAAMTDGVWELADGNMTNGEVNVQSKTRADGANPCFRTAQNLWQNLPRWLKDDLFSDFSSGDNIAEKLKFMREADETTGKGGRNIILQYFAAVYNAMDGHHNVKKCILDEVLKWVECSFADTVTNYKKFIMPGRERRGLFDIFSSPSDTDTKSNEEGRIIWEQSNPDELTETGSTASRLHRYYSNPLEGLQGFYDAFGDADKQEIYDHIMRERKNCKPEMLMGEIRGFPLNEDEMFQTFNSQSIWDNHEGISARKIYLMGTRFKDQKTKEPKVVWGNLEWENGEKDKNVVFRQYDTEKFDVAHARFCFSYLPQNREPLKYAKTFVNGADVGERPIPPVYVENCLGIDPFGKRYPGKKFSKGAMVNHKFRDIFETGINKCPTMLYLNRPFHENIFFEDCIRAAVFNRSMAQIENVIDKAGNYFYDRGYHQWLLASFGEKQGSLKTGDAPSGRGAFLDEGIGLINAITNLPLTPDEPYLLELNWLYELLEDVLRLNPKDTHENDATLAWIQALMGALKILNKRVRGKSSLNSAVLDYLLS